MADEDAVEIRIDRTSHIFMCTNRFFSLSKVVKICDTVKPDSDLTPSFTLLQLLSWIRILLLLPVFGLFVGKDAWVQVLSYK